MSKTRLKCLVEFTLLLAALTVGRLTFAQDPPPPPPPGDAGPGEGEATVPPPPPEDPYASPSEPAGDQPPPGAPPSVYKSDQTAAWGQAGATAPTKEDEEKKKKEIEELNKRCAELKESGEELPSECKIADLEVVFQGAVKRKEGETKALPQARDTESESLVEKTITYDKDASLASERSVDIWDVARKEPRLLPDSKSGFITAGIHVGYSWMKGRGSAVEQAYDPIIHAAAEVGYQIFPMFQLALVADFETLKGGSAYDKEVLPTTWYNDQDQTAQGAEPSRYPRDVGALLDNYFGFGLRPTFRVNAEMWNVQVMAGVGLGYHYFKTSGRWRTKLPAEDRANSSPNIDDQARFNGDDFAIYSFDMSDSGLYSVFEAAIMYRLLDARLGLGVLIKYTVPIHGAVEPDVKVEQDYGVHNNLAYDPSWTGYSAQENDYSDTFIRHLGAMSFVTLGLAADWRF